MTAVALLLVAVAQRPLTLPTAWKRAYSSCRKPRRLLCLNIRVQPERPNQLSLATPASLNLREMPETPMLCVRARQRVPKLGNA